MIRCFRSYSCTAIKSTPCCSRFVSFVLCFVRLLFSFLRCGDGIIQGKQREVSERSMRPVKLALHKLRIAIGCDKETAATTTTTSTATTSDNKRKSSHVSDDSEEIDDEDVAEFDESVNSDVPRSQSRRRRVGGGRRGVKQVYWTEDEDKIIKDAHPLLGSKWSQYVPLLSGRTVLAIECRWRKIKSALENEQRDDGSDDDDDDNDDMSRPAKKIKYGNSSGIAWTAGEDAIVKEMYARGCLNAEIAQCLPGRTVGSVNKRVGVLRREGVVTQRMLR
jgi:hypothetical protein